MSKLKIFLFSAAIGLSWFNVPDAWAATTTSWQVTTGDWGTGANWSAGEPSSTVNADISNGGTAQISSGANTIDALTIGNGSSQTGNLQITGGSLTASGLESVGVSGTGSVIQSAGTNNLAAGYGLIVNTTSSTESSYTLSGNGIISSPSAGESVEGSLFTQTGGTNTTEALTVFYNGVNPAALIFSSNSLSTPLPMPTYKLSGGVLSVNNLNLGYPAVNNGFMGSGIFSQAGGQLTCAGGATIGWNSIMSLSSVNDTFPSLNNDGGSLYLGGTAANSATATTVTGNFTQTSNTSTLPASIAQVYIALGGTTPGTEYSTLTIDDSATLAGKLYISLNSGFVPSYGEVFDIINYSSYTGSFDSGVSLPSGSWGSFALAYTSTGVTLTVVPETGLGLMGISLFLLPRRRTK